MKNPFRELSGGVRQQVIDIELALELPSEMEVGKDGSPSLTGQDIGNRTCI